MIGKFIAVSNMKGGVGKTTTVVSVAEFLTIAGASVLIIDLDPQASASLCVAGDQVLAKLIEGGRTLDAFIAVKLLQGKEASLQKRIRRACCTVTYEGNPVLLNLIPTSPQLRLVERQLLYELTRRRNNLDEIDQKLFEFFEENIQPLRQDFDYILFDCAPGISPFTETAIRSSDLVIIPTIPDALSSFGLLGFCEMVRSGGFGGTGRIPALKILFSRVQHTSQHREYTRRILESEFSVFSTFIPQSAALAASVMVDGQNAFNIPTINKKYGPKIIEHLTSLVSEIKGVLI